MIEVILKNLLGQQHKTTMPLDFAYDHGERIKMDEAYNRLFGAPPPEVERRRSESDQRPPEG